MPLDVLKTKTRKKNNMGVDFGPLFFYKKSPPRLEKKSPLIENVIEKNLTVTGELWASVSGKL
jgi:hypothetical protein